MKDKNIKMWNELSLMSDILDFVIIIVTENLHHRWKYPENVLSEEIVMFNKWI